MLQMRLVLTSILLLSCNAYSALIPWKQIKNQDGIRVFKGEIPNSPVVAFKGIGEIPASLKAVTSVLYNIDRKLHWVAKIKEAKIIRKTTPFEVIEYNETRAPWPLQNRDFLFKAKITPESNWKKLTIDLQSVQDELMPKKSGVVRGEIHSSKFVLEEVAPNRTKISLEIHADPKGLIPKWIANLFQKQWPYQTLQNMRKEVTSGEFKVHPHIEKLFQQNI